MKKNNLLIALIAIVFVCLVGVVSYSLLNNDNKDNLDNNTEVEITSSEVRDSLDEKIKILEIDFSIFNLFSSFTLYHLSRFFQ